MVTVTLGEVQDSLDEAWTLGSMAKRAGYHPIHFAHALQAIKGVAPLSYLRTLRLERAAHDLVHTRDKPLFAIGREAGYSSAEAFRRAFLKALGTSPSAMRRSRTLPAAEERPAIVKKLSRPSGTAVAEIVRFGPVTAVSLRASAFRPSAIVDAWRLMFARFPEAGPWELGAATPPWRFTGNAGHREYRCLHLAGDSALPLEPWS